MRKNRWLLIGYLWLLTSFLGAHAQQHLDISYRFEKDTLHLSGPQTFANKLIITNHTAQPVTLRPFSPEPSTLNGLLRLPQKISLGPNEKKAFPLKYMADRGTITAQIQAFIIGLESEDAALRIDEQQSFFTKLQHTHTILLEPQQKEYYLDPATNQTQILLRVVNTGMAPATIQPRFSGFPAGFEITGETQPVTLEGGGQTLLTYTARMPSVKNMPDFDLRIQAADPTGQSLTGASIRIMRVGSVKRFGWNASMENLPFSHSIAMRYLDMNRNTSIYQLQGYGEIDLRANQTLNYRMNLDYYQRQGSFNMYDSYLDYQTKNWGVKIGSIYENLDQSINGRGIKASYKFDGDRSVSVYAVENKYMLFSQMFDFIDGGETMGVNYAVGSGIDQRQSYTYLHRNDEFREVKSDLISGKGRLEIGENQDLLLEGGYSMERAELDEDKHSVALGANYTYNSRGFQFSSINYYSSPYYSGLRRGLTQSDTRLSKTLAGQQRLSAAYSYMKNSPNYQQGTRNIYFNHKNELQTYEVAYSSTINRLQLELKPHFMQQRGTYDNWFNFNQIPLDARSASLRLAASANFNSGQHRLSLRPDYGYTNLQRSDRRDEKFHSLRFTGNYNYRALGFYSFIQINPYYLSDLLAAPGSNNYSIYSLGPNMELNAFNGRLQGQLAAVYSYYKATDANSYSLTANLHWMLRDNWKLTADIYYTLIDGTTQFALNQGVSIMDPEYYYSFDSRQIRVGVEKNFGRKGSSKGYKLQLLAYEDRNNNGIKEEDEPAANGVILKIGEQAAITDERGRVKFTGVSADNYALAIQNNEGWVAQGPMNITVTKNRTVEIPLVKSRSVKGSIKIAANKYLKSAPQLGGIQVEATDDAGRHYQTLTDAQGNYTFYLPQGTYNLSVPCDGLPFSIKNPLLEVIVNGKSVVHAEDFIYVDESRQIDIKRF